MVLWLSCHVQSRLDPSCLALSSSTLSLYVHLALTLWLSVSSFWPFSWPLFLSLSFSWPLFLSLSLSLSLFLCLCLCLCFFVLFLSCRGLSGIFWCCFVYCLVFSGLIVFLPYLSLLSCDCLVLSCLVLLHLVVVVSCLVLACIVRPLPGQKRCKSMLCSCQIFLYSKSMLRSCQIFQYMYNIRVYT
jgi:hypothetical protein